MHIHSVIIIHLLYGWRDGRIYDVYCKAKKAEELL